VIENKENNKESMKVEISFMLGWLIEL